MINFPHQSDFTGCTVCFWFTSSSSFGLHRLCWKLWIQLKEPVHMSHIHSVSESGYTGCTVCFWFIKQNRFMWVICSGIELHQSCCMLRHVLLSLLLFWRFCENRAPSFSATFSTNCPDVLSEIQFALKVNLTNSCASSAPSELFSCTKLPKCDMSQCGPE